MMRGMPHMANPSGYTLLEILIALAVVAVIASLALPLGARTLDHIAVRTDANFFASRLRRLEQAAISKQKIYVIRERGASVVVNSQISLKLPHGSDLQLSAKDDALIFYPDGTTNGASFAVGGDGSTVRVRVRWLVGTITVEAAS